MQYVEMGYLRPIENYDSEFEKILQGLDEPINFLELVNKLGEESQDIIWKMYDCNLISIDYNFTVTAKTK